MELLISRYILEIEKDTSLFKKYGNGWYPNFDKYRSFLHKQEVNNRNFSKLINSYNLIKNSNPIVESVMSLDLVNVTNYLKNQSTKIVSSYGTICLSVEEKPQIQEFNYYISNGIYHNTCDILLETYAKSGKFIVGVCDNPESVFYKENLERIKEIENILKTRKIIYDKLSHINHRDKCIILTNRSKGL